MKKIIIKIEKLPRLDMRLGRNVQHDSRSLDFPFNTAGLEIVNVKHERYIPVLNQGQVGSCVGNAGIGAISSHPFLNKDNGTYSRDETGALKLYSDCEVIDGTTGYPPTDNGSYGLSAMKALKNAGLISEYRHTFTLEDALKAGSQYVWITGTRWHSDMFNPDPDGRVHISGNVVGGHEYELSEIDVDNGRIWFWNSWSENWGQQGRFYLTWADYATLLSESGDVTVPIPVTAPTPTPVPPVIKVRTLRLTSPLMQGEDVKFVQTKLGIKADGVFGINTKNAVIVFQHANGLRGDGIVGPKTLQVIKGNTTMEATERVLKLTTPMMVGEDVKVLQRKLQIAADGIFGNQTRIAVIAFQHSKGLTPDGIVGAQTWAALNNTLGVKDTIVAVCTAYGIEPTLGVAVATAESGLNPKATLYNSPSKSTDRGLYQWNNKYHPEITDAMAFDPAQATTLFCKALKANPKNLHAYWSASEHSWKKHVSAAILQKYGIV